MVECQTIESAVREATERLRAVTDAPRLEAELLMARAINMPRSFLFAHPEDVLDDVRGEPRIMDRN